MSWTKTATMTVTEAYRLDMSTISAFVNKGVPDLELDLTFRAPHLLSIQRLITSVHREVLTNSSPIFASWLRAHTNPVLVRDIEDVNRDCKGFREFLMYHYTKELTPLNLVPVFGYAMQFKVKLDVNKFKTALSCYQNIHILLEKFQTTEKELQLDYLHFRGFILDKIDAMPMEILSASYFPFMGATTLEVVIERLAGKVPEDTLVEALLGWAKFECDRQGLPQNRPNIEDVIPSPIVDICHLNQVALESKLDLFYDGSDNGAGNGHENRSVASRSGKRHAEEETANVSPTKKSRDDRIVICLLFLNQNLRYSTVDKCDRIISLKRSLIRMEQIKLQFNNQCLEDEKTFEDYNIQCYDMIFQV